MGNAASIERAIQQIKLGYDEIGKRKGKDGKNIENAISYFENASEILNLTKEPQEIWVSLQILLGNAYQERIQGDKASNIEQAIYYLNNALSILEENSSPEILASVQVNLGNAYRERIQGTKSDNIEQAIKYSRNALNTFNQGQFPIEYASLQANLGNAYRERIQGKKSNNIEQAIIHYKNALEIKILVKKHRDVWAKIQSNLGTVYLERNKAEDIEDAIQCCNFALEVFTRDAFPIEWAIVQVNLGCAYKERKRGAKVDNFEEAIHHYQNALGFFDKEKISFYWGIIYLNLSAIYLERVNGSKIENIEESIKSSEKALNIFSQENYPEQWTRILMNLGAAYRNRLVGAKDQNIEKAIEHLEKTLNIENLQFSEIDKAKILMNLGNAYLDRIRENHHNNIKKAIEYLEGASKIFERQGYLEYLARTQTQLGNAYYYLHQDITRENEDIKKSIEFYNKSLKILNKENSLEDWIKIQLNLGNAYIQDKDLKGKNIEEAILHYEAASTTETQNNFPEDWVKTQMNLGTAYLDRVEGSNKDNISKAISYYNDLLKFLKSNQFPQHWAETQRLLGLAYFLQEDWKKACEACYHAELAITESALLTSDTENQAKILSKINSSIARHVYSQLKLNQPEKALLVWEKGKARLLNQALVCQRLKDLDEDNSIMRLKQELIELQYRSKTMKVREYLETSDIIAKKQNELQKNIEKFAEGKRLENEQDWTIENLFKKMEESNFAIVTAIITALGTALLLITPKKQYHTIFLPALLEKKMDEIKRDWLNAMLQSNLDWTKWCEQQPDILERLGQALWPELDELLQKERIEKILWQPSGPLWLYPLHATQFTPKDKIYNKIYPLERYIICYTPSLHSYDELSRKRKLKKGNILFVEDPEENLQKQNLENSFAKDLHLKEKIYQSKGNLNFLYGQEITRKNIIDYLTSANIFHYYGHGLYVWDNVTQSAIQLYSAPNQPDKSWLSLEEIERNLTETQLSLVVLGACETGIIDIANDYQEDQYIGLPAGFLQAGVKCVIASLWPVDNEATVKLFKKFYEKIFSDKVQSPAMALRQSQLEILQESSPNSCNTSLGVKPVTSKSHQHINKIQPMESNEQISSLHTNSVYWAAFYIVGNGFGEFCHI